VLITLADKDKGRSIVETAMGFQSLGFEIIATKGTFEFLSENGIVCKPILKIYEGRPNVKDDIMNRQIHLINTPIDKWSKQDDSYIRKMAVGTRSHM